MDDDEPVQPTETASRPRRVLLDMPHRYAGALRLVRASSSQWVVVVLALSVMSGVALALQLLVSKEILEILTEDANPHLADLTPWLVALGVLLLITALATTSQQRLQDLITEQVARQALDQVLAVSVAVPYASFEQPEFHDDLRKAEANAIPKVWSTVLGLVGLTNHIISMLALILVIATVMPALLVFAPVAYVPLWWATSRNSADIHRASVGLAETDRDLAYHRRVLSGRQEAKELRAFALGDLLRRRHRALFDLRVERVRQVVFRGLGRSLVGLTISTALLIGAITILLWQTVDGPITVASAAVGIVGLQQLGGRVRALDGTASALHQGMLFFEDFETFIARAPAVTGTSTDHLDKDLARLEVRDLGFSYPGTERHVLEDVSLTIEGGQLVALVGPNGSGKTTLAKILCGLYRPTNGEILWNDTDLADIELGELRRRVAPVFQDFNRYELSAHDNIAFGDPARADDDAVHAAGRDAGADEFLRALPDGYQTRLSREYAGGAELSIGQWQRLAIARCFLRDAPLIVLDEPSSALDAHAEAELFSRARELADGRAVVFISHRLASVRAADHILVLEQGHVVQRGTHDELVDQPGTYRGLYELQARRYVDLGDFPAS